MTPTHTDDFVRRPEMEQAVEGIRRELSGLAKTQAETREEMNDKLDRILEAKVEDARQMGELQQQVSTLQASYQAQRDGFRKVFVKIVELLAAAGIGYAAKKGLKP
jgi:hypothetical protein